MTLNDALDRSAARRPTPPPSCTSQTGPRRPSPSPPCATSCCAPRRLPFRRRGQGSVVIVHRNDPAFVVAYLGLGASAPSRCRSTS